jgi:hypothetical protein
MCKTSGVPALLPDASHVPVTVNPVSAARADVSGPEER